MIWFGRGEGPEGVVLSTVACNGVPFSGFTTKRANRCRQIFKGQTLFIWFIYLFIKYGALVDCSQSPIFS